MWLCAAGRDLIGVQNLMKKHQALQAELGGHEPRIQNVCTTGKNMVKEGHFAHDTINGKIGDLQDRWMQLKVPTAPPPLPPPPVGPPRFTGSFQVLGN